VRYIMALDYFALNGPNWFFAMNFMSGYDVCSWNGFSAAYSPNGAVQETGGLFCDSGLPLVLDLEVR
jgi:hypothetical protein